METSFSGDDIAEVVLEAFDSWPSKRKPMNRGNGTKEWVPMSGIVAEANGKLTCLAVATGMKCLPQNKISHAQGVTLHDWHAEVLAIRTFNRFLLEECKRLSSSQAITSEWLQLRSLQDEESPPFVLKDGINFHIYCSEAPCGDASMELTMAAQSDSTPWEIPPPITTPPLTTPLTTSSSETIPFLQGRSYFSQLGSIRRKPSRPDAPPNLSKSCSDKLALKQSTSLLSSITSLFILPKNIYLTSLVLPESQYSSIACDRAFGKSGRLVGLDDNEWQQGYMISNFEVKTTKREFSYSRRQELKTEEGLVPSNLASFSSPTSTGTLIAGSLQGRKQFSLKGAPLMSKKLMWALALEIADALNEGGDNIKQILEMESYLGVKQSYFLDERRRVKSEVRGILGGAAGEKGWVRNVGGEDFGLEDLGD